MRTQFDDEPGARKTMLRRVTIQPDIQMDLWFEGGRAVVQDVATGVLSYGATGICALTRALQARDTVWKVDGLSKNERVIYEYMNECQKRRTEELDRAIQILRSHTN